jgi:hypothetical protein
MSFRRYSIDTLNSSIIKVFPEVFEIFDYDIESETKTYTISVQNTSNNLIQLSFELPKNSFFAFQKNQTYDKITISPGIKFELKFSFDPGCKHKLKYSDSIVEDMIRIYRSIDCKKLASIPLIAYPSEGNSLPMK